jgi:hypothetical protein
VPQNVVELKLYGPPPPPQHAASGMPPNPYRAGWRRRG